MKNLGAANSFEIPVRYHARKVEEMNCKFNETKECIKTELFDMWKDNKKETAWLMLGVCPKCPIYREDVDCEEMERSATD